MYKNYSY